MPCRIIEDEDLDAIDVSDVMAEDIREEYPYTSIVFKRYLRSIVFYWNNTPWLRAQILAWMEYKIRSMRRYHSID